MSNTEPIRVLVVDDTAIYRKVVSEVLSGLEGIEVVGTAVNGRIALEKCDILKPHLMTLDLEMPDMNGLDVLQHLKEHKSPIGAIMLSAFTNDGAETTLEALAQGAFDFVLKPFGNDLSQNLQDLREILIPKVYAFGEANQVLRRLHAADYQSPVPKRQTQPKQPSQVPAAVSSARTERAVPEVVALGISTGGPQALRTLLQKLPADLQVPVLIVQHMPPKFTLSLARDLDAHSDIKVTEARDGELVLPGTVYIAPGGAQMKVKRRREQVVIEITDDPPENSCRPSVDYLFRSVAETYSGNTLAVIMTGMGNDGTEGCKRLKQLNATLICQDQDTCVVFGMPREPVELGLADFVLPLDDIADRIVSLVNRKVYA